MKKTFVGIGFGPIQAGLFLYEAFNSGHFGRLVVAEIMPDVVAAIRQAEGKCLLNIATETGIEHRVISGIEILNPANTNDRDLLIAALAEADEIATALPSVSFYKTGGEKSVAALLAEGIKARLAKSNAGRCIIYTAENHNHAAEILWESMAPFLDGLMPEARKQVQCLNTVIGKMSGVVSDEAQIREQQLKRITGEAGRCFLVESFNRILISRIPWPDFQRGITVFEEKNDLLPFEEAKLYGHNATHALIGYLARRKGYRFISDAQNDTDLLKLARAAFITESGEALCRRHNGLDRLFTPGGYAEYADDLLKRMLNPHLRDTIERVVRDPRRKLGWDDRLIGTMRLVAGEGIEPQRYTLGARAALEMLSEEEKNKDYDKLLESIWQNSTAIQQEKNKIKEMIFQSRLKPEI